MSGMPKILSPADHAGRPTVEREPRSTDRGCVLLASADLGSGELVRAAIERLGYDVVELAPTRSFDRSGWTEAVALVVDAEASDWSALPAQLPASVPKLLVASAPDFATRLLAARSGYASVLVHPVDTIELSHRLDSAARTRRRGRYSAILVDDAALPAELHALVLRHAGFDVRIVDRPECLLPALEDELPDVLLLDLTMPDVDGIELAKVVRQSRRFDLVPILFLSSVQDQDRQLAARRSGGDDFIVKPVHPQRFVAQVSLRIERSREQAALIERDGLTGVLNHGHFADRLAQVARTAEGPVAMAMIDIDRFKAVNDTWGHSVGDRVIRALSNLLASGVGACDAVGRCGGEEFGVLLPGSTAEEALGLVDGLREAFGRMVFEEEGGSFSVGFSAGVAILRDRDARTMAAEADSALYIAKRRGRNRVEICRGGTFDLPTRADPR